MQQRDRKTVTLVLGGACNGKSRWALEFKTRVAYVAKHRFCGIEERPRGPILAGAKHTLLPFADLRWSLKHRSQFIQAQRKLRHLGWRRSRLRSPHGRRGRLDGVSPVEEGAFFKRMCISDSKRDRRRL